MPVLPPELAAVSLQTKGKNRVIDEISACTIETHNGKYTVGSEFPWDLHSRAQPYGVRRYIIGHVDPYYDTVIADRPTHPPENGC